MTAIGINKLQNSRVGVDWGGHFCHSDLSESSLLPLLRLQMTTWSLAVLVEIHGCIYMFLIDLNITGAIPSYPPILG